MNANTVTLAPGHLLVIPGYWGERLVRIDQLRNDGFQLVFDENEPAMQLELDTRGFNRHSEEGPLVGEPPRPAPIPNLECIKIEAGDLITVPGLGVRTLGSIEKLGESRYRLRLDQKWQPSVHADVDMRVPEN